jgi:hypothetical protein
MKSNKKSNDGIFISLNVLFERKKCIRLLSSENKSSTNKRRELWITFGYFCLIKFDHLIQVRDDNNLEKEKVESQNVK